MINKEILKKQIIYRSIHRGTKEMDLLLGNFVKKHINEFNDAELLDLKKLIYMDDEVIFDTTLEGLNNKLAARAEYCNNNGSVLNTEKTEIMIMHNKSHWDIRIHEDQLSASIRNKKKAGKNREIFGIPENRENPGNPENFPGRESRKFGIFKLVI